MKRVCLFLIMVILLFVLSGCISADLSYTLADDHTMSIDYRLSFENPNQDVSLYLSEIGSYWADQGMSVYADNETSSLTGERTQAFDSAKAAADAFAGVFTSQDTIFSDATFSFNPSFSADTYSLTAKVSLIDIIRQSEVQGIPADQIAALDNSAKQGAYTISVTLPGNVTETNADQRDGNTCIWNLTYGETKALILKSQVENTARVQRYHTLENMVQHNGALIFISFAAAGLCIVIIIVSVLIRRIKRKRASEIRIKHFR